MPERLLSVGLDVGTTSTQMILSELEIENKAGSFTVPEMEIADRKILYKSSVHFTPLRSESHVDGDAIRALVEREYAQAGIRREDVDTGAVIITGETSRKENARTVLDALADFAGDFVVATAGPDLESILAAKGAGADRFSEETGKTVLHMDIGGGTSNLALIREGKIIATGCLNVGGRLLKFHKSGVVTYVSPVLDGICPLKVGDMATRAQVEDVACKLVQALEMAAGLREKTELLERLWTKDGEAQRFPRGEAVEQSETEEERRYLTCGKKSDTAQKSNISARIPLPPQCAHWGTFPPGEGSILSFSGGVADCIEENRDWLEFGDMGPILGQEIRKSRLCAGEYRLGSETIRATVIGAGCHSAQLSGSTVFHRNVEFPLKNLPVILLSEQEQTREDTARLIRLRRAQQDRECVLHLPGIPSPSYGWVKALAQAVVQGMDGQEILVAVENDMAKALGQAIAALLPQDESCLCIDSVKLTEGSFLDVGAPVGPALPVVVKTLVLSG